MQLLFLGTRGGIKPRSITHYNHASMLITSGRSRIIIDCGSDWLEYTHKLSKKYRPDALLLTHAHDDHAGGLAAGSPCPVYATQDTFDRIRSYPLKDTVRVTPGKPFAIKKFTCTAYAVEHSTRAPAVGYKISDGTQTIFYVPDVALIKNPRKMLKNVDIYIGDGALLTRTTLVREKEGIIIGHAPVVTQLEWCAAAGVTHMIVTHCGSEIVRADPESIAEQCTRLGRIYGIDITVARDGMVIR